MKLLFVGLKTISPSVTQNTLHIVIFIVSPSKFSLCACITFQSGNLVTEDLVGILEEIPTK